MTANQALADLLGRPLTELAGSAFADITHPDDNSGDVAAALTMVHGARRLAWEKRYLHADGSAVWIEIHAATLESLNGTKMTIGHIVDIRDRRLRESEQARNNRFLEALTEVTRGLLGAREDSFDLIARCGTACVEGRGAAVVHVRADEVRLLGTHGTGFDRSAIVSVDSSGTIVEQVMRSGIAQLLRDDAKVEDVGLPGDVAGVFASLLLTPLMRRGVSDGVLIVGRGQGVNAFEPVELDLLTRFSQQASIALEVAEARVAQQLVEAAGQRARIARDLHDTIADCISAISIQADAAALIVHDDPKRAVVALQRIRDATSESLRDMRRVIALLRAGDAETDSGISRIDELRALARGASAFVELQVACEALDTSVEVWRAMYRIVQESLTNVRRHCPASTRIDLGISVETAMKTDQDNETGSVVRILVSNDQCAATWFVVGHGLTGMRERVELLGGRFTAGFDSSHRWIVDAAIPIDRAGT